MTVIVGFLGAAIALFAWITAHQKLVVDLFDRRLVVYDELRRAVASFNFNGVTEFEALVDFARAKAKARFLFGSEVIAYLDERQRDILEARRLARRIDQKPIPQDEADRELANEIAIYDRLEEFDSKMDALVAPYMNLHQKLPALSFVAGTTNGVKKALWFGLSQRAE